MKKITRFCAVCSAVALAPIVANAAGTYYTGATYQAPQTRYGQSASYTNNSTYSRPMGYNTNGYASTRYNTYTNNVNIRQQGQMQQQQQSSTKKKSSGIQNGFLLDGGLIHENAMWKMEMNESSSMLHYDNLSWNVLDLKGKYVFDSGNTKMQIGAGFKYGLQWDETSMVDDDISKGGYLATEWWEDTNSDGVGDKLLGRQVGHALSIGTSSGGSMLGFNVDFGLPNLMQWGGLKITPSVGYRYLKYKLETEKNYGVAIDTLNGSNGCFTDSNGETQCDTILIFYNVGTTDPVAIATRQDNDGETGISSSDRIVVPSGYDYVYAGDTYYFEQSGTSHSYEVAWSGPYIALDMLYDINDKNYVDARVELGFPGYTATGDQPYRYDWQHPKSVEDESGMFSALHLGLAANWTTAISDTVFLSVGVTYDHYSVNGADAKTYLNASYYNTIYNNLLTEWINAGHTEADMLDPDTGDATAINIKKLESECSGWVCKTSGEIDSIYRSLGVRVGLSARF